ncbi:MAG: 50S ribosome-binding GTPase [Bacteroidales bacterium]|nr:50S ribosome-binding GTPase [Bacteroidales bacterium]
MERLHIVFLGPVNSGKSTLVNLLCGQEVSLVSPVPGTTTDPVRKVAELPGLGPCVLIDTAGYDDSSALGAERLRLTESAIDSAHIAVLLGSISESLEARLSEKGVPVVHYSGEGTEWLLERLVEAAKNLPQEGFLTGNLVGKGSQVLLVMPQDSEAPKGRLILPQVNVIRELLDRGCIPHCCTAESLPDAIKGLAGAPDLVITDSQVFKTVAETIPADWPLTSFSVLLACAKGDAAAFLEGARAIDALRPGDKVLIAEACTHVPASEDIGRVKIPALLKKKVGDLTVDVAAGNDFPADLSPYRLIIHCGACVASSALVRSRIRKASAAGVPITNYGLAIAFLQGILPRIVLP